MVLLEPSVLGTEEGAGITVLAKNLPRSPRAAPVQWAVPATSCAHLPGLTASASLAVTRVAASTSTAGHITWKSPTTVYGNAGVFSGGVRIGQPYLEGQRVAGRHRHELGRLLGYDKSINIHHNKITNNGTVETNTSRPGRWRWRCAYAGNRQLPPSTTTSSAATTARVTVVA